MRIQALPVGDPDTDDARQAKAVADTIQTGPIVIYTYGTIGPTVAEPGNDEQ